MVNTRQEAPRASEDVHADQKKEQYVYTADQLLDHDIKEVPMLLEPIFPQDGVIALAGSSDTGKSAFLRQFACAVVLGNSDFLGFRLNSRYQKALYISTEDGISATSALLRRQKSVNCVNGDYKKLRFIFETTSILSKIEEQLQKEPVDCVIVDAFADIYEGDINAVNKVRYFLQGFADLAHRYGCLIIFLHHTGKRTESLVPSKDNLIGSQGFEGKMRMVAELRRDPNNSQIRHLCVVKGNYIPQDNKERSFALHFDGETMTFQFTGHRAEFKDLVKREFLDNPDLEKAKAMACILRGQGQSLRDIEAALASLGLPGKKSAIAGWVKEMPNTPDQDEDQDDVVTVDDGQPNAPAGSGGQVYILDPVDHFDD